MQQIRTSNHDKNTAVYLAGKFMYINLVLLTLHHSTCKLVSELMKLLGIYTFIFILHILHLGSKLYRNKTCTKS